MWQVAQRQLRLQGTWEKSDGPLLEAYCHNVVKAREARARAEEYRHAPSLRAGGDAEDDRELRGRGARVGEKPAAHSREPAP